ncbi:MAG: DUF4982 domain-containing protein [Clostridiales bacterium]|nr:DUF4982 domain-containing protein [Clostridiales bacterium]
MKHFSFNENWTCSAYGKTTAVTLPHDAMIGAPRSADNKTGADLGFFTPARAFYTKKFEKPDVADRVLLGFDGVMGLCEVSLNCQHISFHPYGYTGFFCDLTPYLKDGENEITVTADNTAQVASRWYTGLGIYRDVELLISSGDRIVPWGLAVKTLHLHGRSATVEIEVKVEAAEKRVGMIRLALAGTELLRRIPLEKGENLFTFRTALDGIEPWTPESPVLYECEAELDSGDTERVRFGIRTVETDPKRGFLLNGEPIKLYGGCVHHDNGILGAASVMEAEERKIRILKENGFNAIRTAHNPPSAVLLDVCDRLGMMVIDEIFDCWRVGKKDFDYHLWYDGYWEEDTRAMVLRDRNHPSVVLWSTGNEIPEKNGTSDGYQTHKGILDLIRSLDPTRPVTHAFCTFWDNWPLEQKCREGWGKGAEELDLWASLTAPIADLLDVSGYNYLFDRLDKDEQRFPDRLIAMTESFPLEAALGKKRLDSDPRFIGEFVWTAWDYFGETGLGHIEYGKEGSGYGLTNWPAHFANCGDFDITGQKRPAGYYRNALWKKDVVTMAVGDPAHHGEKYLISSWGFYAAERTWTFPGEEGKPTDVFVFSLADEVELFVNGVSLGKKAPDDRGTAKYEAVYAPGEITAKCYRGGIEVGCDHLVTTGEWETIRLASDAHDGLEAGGIAYVGIELCDGEGNPAWCADDEILVSAEGGEVLGTGSGDPQDEHIYTEPACRAYHGKLLAAIRKTAERCTVAVETAGKRAEITL